MRTAIVTGGAYGIGRAIVRRLAADGCSVLIADVNEQRGRDLQSEVAGSVFVRTDVRDEAQIRALVDMAVTKFGRVDVVCSNAGIEAYKRGDEYTAEDWRNISETNLRPAFLLSKYAYPELVKQKGCIVFTASVQAIANEKNISIYAATKAGLLGLMRGLAVDFASAGVRVNAVCPGATMTGMMEAALAHETDPQTVLRTVSESIPLGRIGTPEDIAEAVAFLASDSAAYITGTHLVVDGGLLAKLAI